MASNHIIGHIELSPAIETTWRGVFVKNQSPHAECLKTTNNVQFWVSCTKHTNAHTHTEKKNGRLRKKKAIIAIPAKCCYSSPLVHPSSCFTGKREAGIWLLLEWRELSQAGLYWDTTTPHWQGLHLQKALLKPLITGSLPPHPSSGNSNDI